MPDEQAKIVKEIPRDAETIELFKNLPAPDLCRRASRKDAENRKRLQRLAFPRCLAPHVRDSRKADGVWSLNVEPLNFELP